MDDHESYLLLAARSLMEPLSRDEAAALETHLSECHTCRSTAGAMRRDDIRLRTALAPMPVAPRVRERVLSEASGSRRVAGRYLLLLAATLGLALFGVPLITGRPAEQEPSVAPTASLGVIVTPSAPVSVRPSASAAPSPSAQATISPAPSATTRATGNVNGSFTYSEFEPRRASISARLVDGVPEGAWSRRVPLTGNSRIWSGTITCLVVDDDEAWMAGPVTASPDDRKGQAIFILVRDRGPQGAGDRALMQISNSGETLEVFEGWCRAKFRPNAPYPVTDGDIRIDAD